MKIYIVIWESKKRGKQQRVSATPFFEYNKAEEWSRRQANSHYPLGESTAKLFEDLEYYSLCISEERVK